MTGEPADPSDALLIAELCAMPDPNRRLRQFRSFAGAHQYRRLYALMRRHVPAGAQVLDWGGGWGHFSYYLARRGYQPTVYSFNDLAAEPWFRPEVELHLGQPDEPVRLPFPDAAFDAVVSVGVLEHVRETGGNEPGSLREIRRVLRPGGTFLCYHFPNAYSAVEAVARAMGKGHHRYRFTRRDIRRLVSDAALELVATRRYGLLPRNFFRLLPGVLRRSKLVAAVWDGLDWAGGRLFSPLCQNHLFVARKPA